MPDADHLVHKTFIGQLRAERRHHVDLAIQDDHRVDDSVRERSSLARRRRLLGSEAFEQVDQALRSRRGQLCRSEGHYDDPSLPLPSRLCR